MRDPRTLAAVRAFIRERRVWMVHFGTPCTEFSVARTRGARTGLGQALADTTASLIRLCERVGVRWSIENPRSSALWRHPSIAQLVSKHVWVPFDCC